MKRYLLYISMLVIISGFSRAGITTPVLLLSSNQAISSYSLSISNQEFPSVYLYDVQENQYIRDSKQLEENGPHFRVELLIPDAAINSVKHIYEQDGSYGQLLTIGLNLFYIAAGASSEITARDYQEMFQINREPIIGNPIFFTIEDSINILYITNDIDNIETQIKLAGSSDGGGSWTNPITLTSNENGLSILGSLGFDEHQYLFVLEQSENAIRAGCINIDDPDGLVWLDHIFNNAEVSFHQVSDSQAFLTNLEGTTLEIFSILPDENENWEINEFNTINVINPVQEIGLYIDSAQAYDIFVISNPFPGSPENNLYYLNCSYAQCGELINLGMEFSFHSQLTITTGPGGNSGVSWIETLNQNLDSKNNLWYLPWNYEIMPDNQEPSITQAPTETGEPEIVEITATSEKILVDPAREDGILADLDSEVDEYIILGVSVIPVLALFVFVIVFRTVRRK